MKIVSKYKWWKNPIKWWGDRKKIKIMNILLNHMNQQGGIQDEIFDIQKDLILFGYAKLKDGTTIYYD
jgi:hypothetical protein